MGTAFWIFLAATIVASLTFVSIIVWVEARNQERKEFYRSELRKRLVDAGKMDAASLGSLMQYEHNFKLRQSRQKLLVAAFIFLGIGIGTCIGLLFLSGAVWMLGLIPATMGLSMLICALFFSDSTNPGPAPLGWSTDAPERE